MTEVVLIDSGGANLASLVYALERLGAQAQLTDDPKVVATASRVILPGVGAAGSIMRRLEKLGLIEAIRQLRCPLLGICLGMQLLFERSEENDTPTLGLLAGRARRFTVSERHPVPHMGWNTLIPARDDPLLADLDPEAWVYFVHSYRLPHDIPEIIAVSNYGEPFAAAVRRDNFYGVQFHPERSGRTGARILHNFLHLG
ncbi:MAG: imidazole glycerol phosphate synthase subunit HisH [Steroidobacteraceae bacterium]